MQSWIISSHYSSFQRYISADLKNVIVYVYSTTFLCLDNLCCHLKLTLVFKNMKLKWKRIYNVPYYTFLRSILFLVS